MAYNPAPLVIERVVDALRIDFSIEQLIPYYEFGVALEVVNLLKQKTASEDYDKKYPLIWYLIENSVEEDVDNRKTNPREVKNAKIIICMETSPDYTSKERYENTFIPILRPLYDAFIYQLGKSKEVHSSNNLSHSYSENLYWGRDGLYGHEGNIFDDRLDAIIISDLDFRIIESC